MVHIAHFVLLGCLSLVSRTILSLQYIEVFRDDFNGNTIDQSKWNRVNAPSTVNGELQYYVPDDTWQESGFAFLRAQKRCNYAGRDYTAGRLDTKDKFQLMYGEVEWRAKLPKGTGLWPALWLLQWKCPAAVPCGGDWPPELDVMEARGDLVNKITVTVHYDKSPNQKYETKEYFGPDFTADFHNFKVLWDPNQVVYYVDGQQIYNTTDKTKIPTENMYLIMNLAVGGFYPGNPDVATIFPNHFIIDWVSVHRWQ